MEAFIADFRECAAVAILRIAACSPDGRHIVHTGGCAAAPALQSLPAIPGGISDCHSTDVREALRSGIASWLLRSVGVFADGESRAFIDLQLIELSLSHIR